MTDEPEPYDAHIRAAAKVFRDVGFTLAAMQWKRGPREIAMLREFNNVPAATPTPRGWLYYPNAAMKAFWEAKA